MAVLFEKIEHAQKEKVKNLELNIRKKINNILRLCTNYQINQDEEQLIPCEGRMEV